MKGIVFIDDRSAVHVIPRTEVRYVEVASIGDDGWELMYQLVADIRHTIRWKGESRPASLKDKIEVGEYNRIAAGGVLTMLTRGHRDLHLERRADNVFLVRSGLIEDDARVALCRQFIVEMTSRLGQGSLATEICGAARDLTLPDWYPIKEAS